MNEPSRSEEPEIPLGEAGEAAPPQERSRKTLGLGLLLLLVLGVVVASQMSGPDDEAPSPEEPVVQATVPAIQPLPLPPPPEPEPAWAPLPSSDQDGGIVVEPAEAPLVTPPTPDPSVKEQAAQTKESVARLATKDPKLAQDVADIATAEAISGDPDVFIVIEGGRHAVSYVDLARRARGLRVSADPYGAIQIVTKAAQHTDLEPYFPRESAEITRLATTLAEYGQTQWKADPRDRAEVSYKAMRAARAWLGRDGETVEFEGVYREVQGKMRAIEQQRRAQLQRGPEISSEVESAVAEDQEML